MKKWIKISIGIIITLVLVYISLPYYAQKALIYRLPKITDLDIFERDTIHKSDTTVLWAKSKDYNQYALNKEDLDYLQNMESISFLVIQNDSIIFEKYFNDWDNTKTSNIYSATKSIVSLLIGIAIDEGKIQSVDDPVCKYLPQYTDGYKKDVTIRHLLTMSASMDWDEAYSSLFSATTHAYYGNDLYDFITGLEITDQPGKQYTYKSGETQLLAFVLEAATGVTMSKYAEEKLWKPLHTENNAYWLLDKKDGDEKAFCCFHTTTRDIARIGHLLLNKGMWHGKRIISQEYMEEATSPATYLKNQWGTGNLTYYGFQIWIINYLEQSIPYMRGMLGQYIYALPKDNAIVVRLGHKRSDEYIKENTTDIYRYLDIAEKIIRSRK